MRAAFDVQPSATSRSVSRSRCERTSALKSSSRRRVRRHQRVKRSSMAGTSGCRPWSNDSRDGVGQRPPVGGFSGELFAAGGGELVESGAPVVLGRTPLGADPPAFFQPLERGVEGAVVY